MISWYLSIWKWFWFFAVGLMLFGAFGPLDDPLGRILAGLGAALSLAHFGAASWEERRERKADQSSTAAISSGDQN